MAQFPPSFGTAFATAGFASFPEFSPNNQQFTAAVLATVARVGLPFGFEPANVVLAGPAAGAAALPTYRALVAADVPGGINGFANPTGLIGLIAVNGTATTAERSDSRHAIDQSISPTWTGNHEFSAASGVSFRADGVADSFAGQIVGNSTSGHSLGLQVRGGTTSGDRAILVSNQASAIDFFGIFGDGHGFLGPSSTLGFSWDANGAVTIAKPSSGLGLTVAGSAAGTPEVNFTAQATTGAQTATFAATNKPGSGTTSPDKWLPIQLDGITHYIPCFL